MGIALTDTNSAEIYTPPRRRHFATALEPRRRKAKKIKTPRITTGDIRNKNEELYVLAGKPHFIPLPFMKGQNLIGYVAPLSLLNDYMDHNPDHTKKTDTYFAGTLEASDHFQNEKIFLKNRKSAAYILMLGAHKGEMRSLALVSPSLYKAIKNWELCGTNGHTPVDHRTNGHNIKIPVADRKNSADIAKLCLVGKAVTVAHLQDRNLVAVPVHVAEKLRKFYPHIKAGVMRSGIYNRATTDQFSAVAEGEEFLTIISKPNLTDKTRYLFTLIPRHMLSHLKFEQNGVIRRVANAKALYHTFNTLAKISVRGTHLLLQLKNADMNDETELEHLIALPGSKTARTLTLNNNSYAASNPGNWQDNHRTLSDYKPIPLTVFFNRRGEVEKLVMNDKITDPLLDLAFRTVREITLFTGSSTQRSSAERLHFTREF